MKTQIVKKGNMVEITAHVNRKNIYLKELERLLNEVNLDPYSKLRFSNDVECYLQDQPTYIEATYSFKKNEYYQWPRTCYISIKKNITAEVRKHLSQMI